MFKSKPTNQMKRLFFLLLIFSFSIASFGQDLKSTLVFERLKQDKQRLQGLVDSLGNVILPAEYGSIRVTDDGKFIVATKQKGYRYVEGRGFSPGQHYPDYKYGVLDVKLDTVLPFIYNNIDTYQKPYYVYHEEKGTAIFDDDFKELFPFKYNLVRYITQPFLGYFYVTNDGFSGVIDTKGRHVIDEKPFWIEPISNELFAVKVKNSNNNSYATTPYYLLDKDWNKIQDFTFEFFRFLTPEIILFNDRKSGLMDTKGTVILPAEYNRIMYDEENEVFIVKISQYGATGMLDKDLKTIIPIEYDEIKAVKNSDLFLISKDKKYGFVNAEGKIVIDMIYDGADVFSEGLAPVLKDGKWGFINEKGEVVIDFQFVGRMKTFENGYATFYQRTTSNNEKRPSSSSKSVFINKKGEMVGEPQVGDIKYFSKDKAIRFNGYGYNSFEHLIDLKTGEIIFELKQN